MARWQPDGPVRASLILLHGFNEYSGAFAEVGEQFARQGVSVWAPDQRGFGRSPFRGLWSSAERMAADVNDLAAVVQQAEPGVPLTVLGMSMGGAVGLLAAGREPLKADALVLVAPAVWIRDTQPFYQRWALSVAGRLVPGWSPTGESLEIRPSDNIEMLRRIWRSPWMIRQSRMDTVVGLNDLMDKAYAAADQVEIPTLLLYGEKDELVPEQPINLLWERLPRPGNSRQIRYAEGWHMLMRDRQGPRVIADIVNWIPKR
ncbi:MAG: alpha/beta hydrolase [Thiolinea sp.]